MWPMRLEKINFKIAAATGFALWLLTACGAVDSSENQNKSQNGISSQDTFQNTSTRIQQFNESYRFVLNGCDTGKHDFTGSDRDSVKQQLCDALQDDPLNHSCAESLRLEFFKIKCHGYLWSPRYTDDSESESDLAPEGC